MIDKELSGSLFEETICGKTCYIRSAEERIRAVYKCNDIESLRALLKIKNLQKSVRERIKSRIKKLEKEYYKQLALAYMDSLHTKDPNFAKRVLSPIYKLSKIEAEASIIVGGNETKFDEDYRTALKEIIRGVNILIQEKRKRSKK